MFKKIFFLMSICLLCFSSIAFALEMPDSKKNYIEFTFTNYGGGHHFYTFDSVGDNGVIYNVNKYEVVGNKAIFIDSVGSTSINNYGNLTFYTNNSLYSSFLLTLEGSKIGDFAPPLLDQVETSLGEMVTELLTVLKNCLPVGVMLLSMVLVVSLIPRLFHLFL